MLDPRNKFEYVELLLIKIYYETYGAKRSLLVEDAMFALFNEYKWLHFPSNSSATPTSSTSSTIEKCKMPFDKDVGEK